MKGKKGKLRVVEGGAALSRAPVPPAHLSPHAKAEWRRVAPVLTSRKIFGADMRATFEAYCQAVGMVRDLQDRIALEGAMLTVGGVLKPHPAARLVLSYMRELRLLAAELGLTPHRRKGAEADDDEEGGGGGWDPNLLA